MKKVLFIIFFIFILVLGKKNNNVITTFIEYNNLYNKYFLDITNCNITTKNINEKFNTFNIKIIALYPHIEKYYINILGDELNYFYIDDTSKLSLFNKYYNSLLEKLGLNNYKNYVSINGIKIDKMIIYSKNNVLQNLKREYSCINI